MLSDTYNSFLAPAPSYSASPVVPDTAQGVYTALQGMQPTYDVVDRYLNGEHDLRFATEKFTNAFGGLFRQFANNYMKRVVNALSDYLQLDTIDAADKSGNGNLTKWIEKQRLQVQSGRIHADAFSYGNGYAIVAENRKKELRLYRQDPRMVAVVYDPEEPERVLLALKLWRQLDKTWRLNVYTPEVTQRFVTVTTTKDSPPDKVGGFVPMSGVSEVKNDLGIVPVFHFANDPGNDGQGTSELKDLKHLQDGLNKSVMDMLVAMEFQAYRQRWATGIEIERDPDTNQVRQPYHGADRLWVATPALDGDGKPVPVQFGEFGVVDLTQFLSVSEAFRTEIARLSRIPLHHLMMAGDFPSGEALKTAEGPLLAKVRDRQMQWGNTWEDLADYVCQYLKIATGEKLTAVWTDVAPMSAKDQAAGDLAEAQAAAEKVDNLFISRKQAQRELGYTEEQITQFTGEIKDEQALKAMVVQTAPVTALTTPPSQNMPGSVQTANPAQG